MSDRITVENQVQLCDGLYLTSNEDELELRSQIQTIALEMRAYGYRPITAELHRRSVKVNNKRVLRLLREDNLLCLRQRAFMRTTDSRHNLMVYPNLTPGYNRKA